MTDPFETAAEKVREVLTPHSNAAGGTTASAAHPTVVALAALDEMKREYQRVIAAWEERDHERFLEEECAETAEARVAELEAQLSELSGFIMAAREAERLVLEARVTELEAARFLLKEQGQ